MRKRWIVTSVALLLAIALPIAAQDAAKRPLDHSDYDGWRTLRGSDISRDGKWLYFSIAPQVGDAELTVRSADGAKSYTVARGTVPRFSRDSKFLVATVVPSKADTDKAKKEKKKPDEMPKNSLAILNLETGDVKTFERLRVVRVPDKDAGWIAYQLEPPAPAPAAAAPKPDATKPEAGKADAQANGPKKDRRAGNELILRELATGTERKLADVNDYAFSKDGSLLAYTVATKSGDKDGAYLLTVNTGKTAPLMTGLGDYKSPVINDKDRSVAFLSNRDDYKADQPAWGVYVQRAGDKQAKLVAKEGSEGLAKGWWVSDRSAPRFSDSGRRVFFATVEKPAPKTKEPEQADDEKVNIDIWNWKDPELQPMQLLQAAGEANRTYDAVADLSSGRILQLETPDFRNVTVGAKGDADTAVAMNNLPYRQEISWDGSYSDVYLVDLKTGQRRKLLTHFGGFANLSPTGKYLSWYDDVAKVWRAMEVSSGKTVDLSAGIPYPVYDELHDTPDLPNAYGSAGWTKGDRAFLVYDNYDVWACDPSGAGKPVCVTDGYGRKADVRLRVVDLDREKEFYDPDQTLLLSAFNVHTKVSGFFQDKLGSYGYPRQLVMSDERFGIPQKAEDADTILVTRETFSKPRDLWVTNSAFGDFKQMSDLMPQQNKYLWGTDELVEWTSLNRDKLQGILFKPANFDRMKKYPMLVYFYERMSDTLHNYRSPGPSADSISPSFYASRGYLVFIPDIPYRVGYPGESALAAILPGVQKLAERGFVDMDHIGMQGHSWGGYQVAYLVTATNMFACGEAGAPVANMTSAYGGIRWASGMSREFQYEKTQSRIGGTLWDKPMQFLENSPLFHANKVETPLLMMANDNDGAVPWYQGIEYFSALRRLGKPVWMLNYNGEGHGLSKRQNQKDFSQRMQQFFDHYLKGAPMPVWMAEGVPASKKGKTLGLEPSGGK